MTQPMKQLTDKEALALRREQRRKDRAVSTDGKGAAIGYRCARGHGGSTRVYFACVGHWECAGCGHLVGTDTVLDNNF